MNQDLLFDILFAVLMFLAMITLNLGIFYLL